MNIKLTLKLDSTVIARAKKRNTSLSKMIESYLDSVTWKDITSTEITPLVKSLSGVIKLPADFDPRKENTDHLDQKYS